MSARSKSVKALPFVSNIAEIPWLEFPGHFGGALSKALVAPEVCGSQRIDHRISSYQPMAHVAEHVHRVQEQVYHVLEGELTVIAGGKEIVARPGDTCFIGPNENREIVNRGNGVCTILVAAAAPPAK